MNFTGVVQEILARTKRPDKLTDIRREVNSAILFFCTDVNANRDLVEANYSIVATEYTQSLPLSTFARYRKFAYIKYVGTKRYILPLDVRQAIAQDCKTVDRYYVAGSNLNLSLGTLAAQLSIAYYQYPPILTDAAPDHWLLEEAWNCVFDRAVAKIYADIDDTKAADRHEGYARMAWLAKRADLERSAIA